MLLLRIGRGSQKWFQHGQKLTEKIWQRVFRTPGSRNESVTCWFCGEDNEVERGAVAWSCFSCEQRNGFDENGDYLYPDPAQFEVREANTGPKGSRRQQEFHTAGDLLCPACSKSQALKVRQLANFQPLDQSSFEEESEAYGHYLEDVYALCPACECTVTQYLANQDKSLVEKMDKAGISLHDCSKQGMEQEKHCSERKSWCSSERLSIVSIHTLFVLCMLAGCVRAVLQLRMVLPTALSKGTDVPYQVEALSEWLVKTVTTSRARQILEWTDVAGPVLCVGAMAAAGKHSLYLEDAIHLGAWTVSILATLVSDLFPLREMEGQLAALTLSLTTALVACLCGLKPRTPRHIANISWRRKELQSSSRSNDPAPSETPQHQDHPKPPTARGNSQRSEPEPLVTNKDCLPPLTQQKEHTSVPNPPSPPAHAPIEGVREDLELFTLGLKKSSGDRSSIWSLPSIATPLNPSEKGGEPSPPMAPDSTTPDSSSCLPLSQRAVLCPSRLGYLTFDLSQPLSRGVSPTSAVDEQSPLCRPAHLAHACPSMPAHSPSSQSNPLSHGQPNSFTTQEQFERAAVDSFSSQPMQNKFSDNDKDSGFAPIFQSGDHNLSYQERLMVDSPSFQMYRDHQQRTVSQTQEKLSRSRKNTALQPQMMKEQISHHKNYSGISEGRSQPVPFTDKLPEDDQPRRSARIAARGKLRRPWPLKKSLSCSNAYSATTDDLAGSVARLRAGADLTCGEIDPSSGQLAGATRRDGISRDGGQNRLSAFHRPWDRGDSRTARSLKGQREKLTEFSDDDEDDDGRNVGKKSLKGIGQASTEMPWLWLAVGLVLGISITCNVFLVLLRQHAPSSE